MGVAKQTLLQFSVRPADAANASSAAPSPRATLCGACGQRFSSDGRFCPFDGQALTVASDWDPSLDPLVGTVIDNRYQVERVLGQGGMGVVYAARHTALGKRFALKALRSDLCADPQLTARFVQEARAAASVRHPGLVEITDFGRLASGQAYFVMEYLEGQSLNQVLRQAGPLSARRTIDIARQAAEALHVAHQSAIVHRDLKPSNIHLDPGAGFGERVRIVDFGLARVAGSSRLTQAGIVYGTPHYMSPEQAAGEAADQRSDIYSLGVVMYEMITGRVPFEADTYLGVLSMHMYSAPEHPRKFAADLRGFGALESVILCCLQKNPADRYPSLRALLDELMIAEQPAEASAVRPRHSLNPHGQASLRAHELEVASAMQDLEQAGIPTARGRLWATLAMVAVAFTASISLALVFRPKHQVALPPRALSVEATAPSIPSTPSLQSDALASPATTSRATPFAPEPSTASATARPVSPAPSAHRARPLRARPSLKSPGSSEIVDPWRK
jgi:serine/threonine-protein kinase